MSNEEIKFGAARYWDDMYRRQIEEISQNEYEKRLLIELNEGNSIIGSIKVLTNLLGMSVEEGTAVYEDIKNRCNEWEVRNML